MLFRASFSEFLNFIQVFNNLHPKKGKAKKGGFLLLQRPALWSTSGQFRLNFPNKIAKVPPHLGSLTLSGKLGNCRTDF